MEPVDDVITFLFYQTEAIEFLSNAFFEDSVMEIIDARCSLSTKLKRLDFLVKTKLESLISLIDAEQKSPISLAETKQESHISLAVTKQERITSLIKEKNNEITAIVIFLLLIEKEVENGHNITDDINYTNLIEWCVTHSEMGLSVANDYTGDHVMATRLISNIISRNPYIDQDDAEIYLSTESIIRWLPFLHLAYLMGSRVVFAVYLGRYNAEININPDMMSTPPFLLFVMTFPILRHYKNVLEVMDLLNPRAIIQETNVLLGDEEVLIDGEIELDIPITAIEYLILILSKDNPHIRYLNIANKMKLDKHIMFIKQWYEDTNNESFEGRNIVDIRDALISRSLSKYEMILNTDRNQHVRTFISRILREVNWVERRHFVMVVSSMIKDSAPSINARSDAIINVICNSALFRYIASYI